MTCDREDCSNMFEKNGSKMKSLETSFENAWHR